VSSEGGGPAAQWGGAALTVLEPGPLTTIQDLGRRGFAHLGVPRAGALDAAAARYANRLVGNPEGAAVLETTMTGVALRVHGTARVAVTGAPAPVEVAGCPRPFAEAFIVRDSVLTVGAAASGVRTYLAFAGGVDAPPVLGSRSTDTLSGLGPAPIAAGDRIGLGAPGPPAAAGDVPIVRGCPEQVRLRIVPGPRVDWFVDDVLDRLVSGVYTVSHESNRVGVRLTGPPLPHRRRTELPSEGLVLGAVQVPAAGLPMIFLNDHPTTGGYPVVGVVAAADLASCAQLRPGYVVRFTPA
jgi:biotin-dependent carboxylase-like uncharacterized protein